MSPRPRRRSPLTRESAAWLWAVITAFAFGIVGGAVYLHDRASARADADRLRAIGRELSDAAEERRRAEAGIRMIEASGSAAGP